MAEAPTETTINCPACQTPLTIPIRLEMTSTREGTLTADTTAVRQHIDDHDNATCTATIKHPRDGETIRCAQPAGHYDEEREPTFPEDGPIDKGGWHQAHDPKADYPLTWCDRADGATPAGAPDA